MSEKNKFDISALLQTFQRNNIQASFVENRKQALPVKQPEYVKTAVYPPASAVLIP